jgi:hypothetical protein
MAAEGARGQTAAEMGEVLRFPAAARRIGGDAQLIPWNTSLLHTGMAELNARLEKAQKPVPQELTDKAAELRKQIQASQRYASKHAKGLPWLKKTPRAGRPAPSGFSGRVAGISVKLNDELAEVLSQLCRYGQYEVHVANALCGQRRAIPSKQPYLETIQKFYQGRAVSRRFQERSRGRPAGDQRLGGKADRTRRSRTCWARDRSRTTRGWCWPTPSISWGNWTSQVQGWTREQDFSVSGGAKVKVRR